MYTSANVSRIRLIGIINASHGRVKTNVDKKANYPIISDLWVLLWIHWASDYHLLCLFLAKSAFILVLFSLLLPDLSTSANHYDSTLLHNYGYENFLIAWNVYSPVQFYCFLLVVIRLPLNRNEEVLDSFTRQLVRWCCFEIAIITNLLKMSSV